MAAQPHLTVGMSNDSNQLIWPRKIFGPLTSNIKPRPDTSNMQSQIEPDKEGHGASKDECPQQQRLFVILECGNIHVLLITIGITSLSSQ